MTDSELVRLTLAGRKEAFAELAQRWAPRLLAICHSRVRRADVAEDLAQETFLRGFRALHTLSDANKVGTWLMGIAIRASLDWLKARERRTIPFSALRPDQPIDDLLSQQDSENPVIQAEERQRLISEVEALPEVFRQVVMLYYYDDLTYRDLAALLNVSTATINARLTKARSLLRERLTRCRSEI